MDHDDAQVGHILSRREVLALLGAGGSQLLVDVSETDDGYAATFDVGLQLG